MGKKASDKGRVPKLRFPGFVGVWSTLSMAEITTKITDGTHDTPLAAKSGVPYITAIHVKDGFVDFDNCYYLTKRDHEQIYKRCNPQFEDLLMVNIGAGTATSALVLVDQEFSMKNVALIKPNKGVICPRYLAQFQRKNAARLFNSLTAGGAQPFLSLKEIGKLCVDYPSLPEQQKNRSLLGCGG